LYVKKNAGKGRIVSLGARELEQLLRVGEARGDGGEALYGGVEGLLLAAQLLGLLLVAPDAGVGEEPLYGFEALLLAVEVKDTSAARPTASAARRA
jgi:hypothetical protein